MGSRRARKKHSEPAEKEVEMATMLANVGEILYIKKDNAIDNGIESLYQENEEINIITLDI